MKGRSRLGLLMVLGLVISLLAVACQGEAGLSGSQGSQGPVGADGKDGRDGAEGSAGPAGPDGPVGARGAQGLQGAAGPQVVAGISVAGGVYDLASDTSLTIMGWGFGAGETVLITMTGPLRDEIVAGPDANEYGAFEKTTSSRWVGLAILGFPAGVYTLSAEGTDGTLASTYLKVVETAK